MVILRMLRVLGFVGLGEGLHYVDVELLLAGLIVREMGDEHQEWLAMPREVDREGLAIRSFVDDAF